MRITRNYLNTVALLDKYKIKKIDESGFNLQCTKRPYGYSERGQRALNIGKHDTSPNLTLHFLVGLSGVKFGLVTTGASDRYTFLQFFVDAVNAFDPCGNPVIQSGDTIGKIYFSPPAVSFLI